MTKPIQYAKHKNSGRVRFTLALTWLVSLAVSLPISLGINYTERRQKTPWLCTFYNADFIIYSSIASFYAPCFLMVWLYSSIFITLRRRAKGTIASKPSLAKETKKFRSKSACHFTHGKNAAVENCEKSINEAEKNVTTNHRTRYLKKEQTQLYYDSIDERSLKRKKFLLNKLQTFDENETQINNFDLNEKSNAKPQNIEPDLVVEKNERSILQVGNSKLKTYYSFPLLSSLCRGGITPTTKPQTYKTASIWKIDNIPDKTSTTQDKNFFVNAKIFNKTLEKSTKNEKFSKPEKARCQDIKNDPRRKNDFDSIRDNLVTQNNRGNCHTRKRTFEKTKSFEIERHADDAKQNENLIRKKDDWLCEKKDAKREKASEMKILKEQRCNEKAIDDVNLSLINDERHDEDIDLTKKVTKNKKLLTKKNSITKEKKSKNLAKKASKVVKKDSKHPKKISKKRKSVTKQSFKKSKKASRKRKAPVENTAEKSQVTTGTTLLLVEAAESTLKTSATILAIQQLERRSAKTPGKHSHSKLSDFGTRRLVNFHIDHYFNVVFFEVELL